MAQTPPVLLESVEGRAGAGLCWEKSQQDPGKAWQRSTGQEQVEQLPGDMGQAQSHHLHLPCWDWGDLMEQKLSSGK